MSVDQWAKEVSSFPVAFSQVREDSLGDMELVQTLGRKSRILMVASGGCTAAYLVSSEAVSHLTIVDPNPAQIQLAYLKLEMLKRFQSHERLELLGHRPMPLDVRRSTLKGLFEGLGIQEDSFGPFDRTVSLGPDHIGRYEQVFARLRSALGEHEAALQELLTLSDPGKQSSFITSDTRLGQAFDQAFDSVFSLDNLIEIFGTAATSNRVQPFSDHFRRRTRIVLEGMSAATNPYLWQVFRGCYKTLVPWIALEKLDFKVTVDSIESDMVNALKKVDPQSYDLVHLSNILDWLGPDSVEELLSLSARALRPGGATIIRQLNSTVDIPGAKSEFTWDQTFADSLLRKDRSFFYRAIHVGRKP